MEQNVVEEEEQGNEGGWQMCNINKFGLLCYQNSIAHPDKTKVCFIIWQREVDGIDGYPMNEGE